MPRHARKLSSASIYHIVIRGLDRQILFECANDYKKYLDIISLYKSECNFFLYAYCLMTNHVHLLIKTTDVSLETIFRKINTHYAVWFNMKYQRTGHLQQERFYSEPVEDDNYLIKAIKYIHNNPKVAGIETTPGASYKWNSIHEYASEHYKLIDSDFVLNITSLSNLLDNSSETSTDELIDVDKIRIRLPDDVAKEIICRITGLDNCLQFNKIALKERNEYIRQFHKNKISIRQINRLTGVPKGIIQRVIKN